MFPRIRDGFAKGSLRIATDSRRVRTPQVRASSQGFAPDITQLRDANARRCGVTSPVPLQRGYKSWLPTVFSMPIPAPQRAAHVVAPSKHPTILAERQRVVVAARDLNNWRQPLALD
eukprot:3971292-Prymnesium_polylepis.1